MKRLFFVLGSILFLYAASITAETATWIDFTKLVANDDVSGRDVHTETMINYSAGQIVQSLEREPNEMVVSLILQDWEVELCSSSQTVENMHYSMAKPVTSERYGTVLGTRIHFPVSDYNAWAMVKPPFEIPAFQHPTKWENGELKQLTAEEMQQANETVGKDPGEVGYVDRNSKFDQKGIVKNVGILKEIKVGVYGSNFPHGLSIRYKDQNNNIQDVFLGYLNFDGWKEIVWVNPNYIQEVKNRELYTFPLYPQAFPFIKFIGFVINRDAAGFGGDFVVYFKDVNVIYDKAVLSTDKDIDDEGEWGILEERERARRASEIKRVGNVQLLREIERQKQAETTESFLGQEETTGGE